MATVRICDVCGTKFDGSNKLSYDLSGRSYDRINEKEHIIVIDVCQKCRENGKIDLSQEGIILMLRSRFIQ